MTSSPTLHYARVAPITPSTEVPADSTPTGSEYPSSFLGLDEF